MCDTITITTGFMAEEVDSANGGHWQTMTTVSVSRVIGISLDNEDQSASFARRNVAPGRGANRLREQLGVGSEGGSWRILPCQVKRSSTTGTHPYSRGDRPSYQCFLTATLTTNPTFGGAARRGDDFQLPCGGGKHDVITLSQRFQGWI